MIKRLFILIVLAGFSISTYAVDLTPPQRMGFSPAKLHELEKHFQGYVDENKLAGLTTLVARRGQLVHLKSYGMMNQDSGKAMTQDAVFRVYSMTKPITGVAMMMLWEEGKFQLDDPVSKYLPAFKEQRVFTGLDRDGKFQTVPAARQMTVRDLMRHTSGLTYGLFGDTPIDRAYRGAGLFAEGVDLKNLVNKLAEQPLLYQPGEAWVYSLATDVQGRLIEVLSGKSLDAFFAERIFAPLSMKDTGFQVRSDQLERFVEIYAVDTEKELTAYRGDMFSDFTQKPIFLSAGGGLVSTTLDYFQFAQMLANGGVHKGTRLLRTSTVDMMREDQLPDNLAGIAGGKQGLGFGLNVAVVKDVEKAGGAGRKGEYFWGGMANTLFWIDPEEDVVAMMMTNILPSGLYPLRNDMRKLVYDALEN